MKYYRYGHLDSVLVNVGDKIKAGQKIGTNGTGNGQWAAHCHFDILKYIPSSWSEFCIGKPKQWVIDNYEIPVGLERSVMPSFDHLGYGWLETATYAGGKAFHPGIDLNGKGSGNSDLGDDICSACDGEVLYTYSTSGKNAGWGKLIIIKECEITTDNNMEIYKKLFKEVKSFVSKDYGDNLDDKDLEDIKGKFEDKKKKIEEFENLVDIQAEKIKNQSEAINALNEKIKEKELLLQDAQSAAEKNFEAVSVIKLFQEAFKKLINFK